MEFLNWLVATDVITSFQTAQNINNRLKHCWWYLFTDSIRSLEDGSLSPLMCIDIAVLFGNIGVIRKWCDIMVSAAGFVNNGGKLECLVTDFQDMAV